MLEGIASGQMPGLTGRTVALPVPGSFQLYLRIGSSFSTPKSMR